MSGTSLTVGIVGIGEMGSAVARVLRARGHRTVTCLEGRGSGSAARAAESGMEPLPDYAALAAESDVLLSVVPPAGAVDLAARVAAALGDRGGGGLLYVDCNAVSPATARLVAGIMAAAGARFADAGIIGPPPRAGRPPTRLYVSGATARELEALAAPELEVRVLGPETGQASGLKMCYAALTKGLTALAVELLVAGRALGLSEPLGAELSQSQPELWAWIGRQLPSAPPKAHRWVGEMEEIAATFASVGLTPELLQGAAAIYRLVEASPLGREAAGPAELGLETAVEVLARHLAAIAPA